MSRPKVNARCSGLLAIALGAVLTLPAAAQTTDIGTLDKQAADRAFPGKAPYSPYAGRNFPTRPFFGDTHLHTSFSMDAGAFGARLGPRDAYVFARGGEITASSGQRVRLSRPLDFLVVADHSDGMGFFPLVLAGDPKIMADAQGRKWYEMIQSGKGAEAAVDIIINFGKGTISKAIFPVPGMPAYRDAWQETIKAAEEANDPGRFTAFIGFEWTSNTGGNNLHRNIIFRDNGLRAGQVEPYTTLKPLGSDNPRDLWKWMTAYEEKTGGQVLAIAHNGNLSNGRMFPLIESFTGRPVDREYAETRAHRERLYEVTQIKGDGETHPLLSPNDEFANYERWDKGNLDLSEPKKREMLEFEYARAALRNGLKLEKELGVNPVQVRDGRLDRRAHRPGRSRRGQLLRQDLQRRAQREPGHAPVRQESHHRHRDHGLGDHRLRIRRGLGDREHPRGPLRCDAAQGSVRHHRPAHDRALLRRLGLRAP